MNCLKESLQASIQSSQRLIQCKLFRPWMIGKLMKNSKEGLEKIVNRNLLSFLDSEACYMNGFGCDSKGVTSCLIRMKRECFLIG
jgi:hypothetical protein